MDPLILAVLIVVVTVAIMVASFVSARRRRGVALDEAMGEHLEERAPDAEAVPEGQTAEDAGAAPPQPSDVDADADEAEAPPIDTGGPVELIEPAEPAAPPAEEALPGEPESPEAPAAAPAPLTARERFRLRLTRARNSLGANVASIFGRGITDEAWEELEESLIGADVGVEATMEIVESLRGRVKAEGAKTGADALRLLKETLRDELSVGDRTLALRDDGTSVWLVTGVNGTGKTTSIGKLAARHAAAGQTVVLAAAAPSQFGERRRGGR
ncbi:MAG: signal recognition particle receptor subunit alpha, partial [Egibacteraceae bacterium]